MRRIGVAVIVALLAACGPKPPAASEPDAGAVAPPPAQIASTFEGCVWGPVSGGGVTINAYACPTSKLEADDMLPGIVQVVTAPDGETFRSPVVQVFDKAADEPMEAALDEVRALSPGAEDCVFAPAREGWTAQGQARFELWPTGEAKAAYEEYLSGQTQDVIIPCGPLGPGEAGAHTFEVLEGAPDKVVMVSWPSDIASFDAGSLRPAR